MARLLPILVVASLVVIAASAFAEEQEDSVGEITLNEADPSSDPEAKRRRGRGGNGDKRRKRGKGRKGGKKGKAMKKKGGKGRTKKNTKRKNRKTMGSRRSKIKAKKGNKSRGCKRVQNAQCGIDAVESLKFEGTVVDNFITQKKRALNFKGIVDKKKGKKANFANATDNMLDALGGDVTAPLCSMTALRMSRASAADATANYATLKNCTTNIESDCGIASGTIDESALETCNETMFAIKTKNAECITAADAAAKCACFVDAAKLVAVAKAGDCKAKGVAANKDMKAQKKKCTTAFAVCNKAEAAASGLINICLGGDDVAELHPELPVHLLQWWPKDKGANCATYHNIATDAECHQLCFPVVGTGCPNGVACTGWNRGITNNGNLNRCDLKLRIPALPVANINYNCGP